MGGVMTRLTWVIALVGGLSLLGATPALAIVVLDFVPASQTVPVGQSVTADVVISGVGRPPSVGAFDLDVSFDPTILSPTGVPVFGLFLGNPGPLEALTPLFSCPVGPWICWSTTRVSLVPTDRSGRWTPRSGGALWKSTFS